MRWFKLGALLAVCLGAVMPLAAEAATFDVTNTSDSGAGSLRQAIIDANANPGPDIIDIDTTGTVTLLSPLPPLTGPTEIRGPGVNDFTIDFDGAGNGIQINPVVVLIRDLTITGSNQGGMFVASGATATLVRVAIVDNTSPNPGGGINNLGTLLVEDSVIRGNTSSIPGGGIANAGTATIRNSEILDNVAGVVNTGGGIFNCAVQCNAVGTILKIYHSTISNNTSNAGGGIDNDAGATLYVGDGTRIFENDAASPGGGVQNQGTATIKDSTVSENTAGFSGAGIFNCSTGCNNATPVLKIYKSSITGNVSNGGAGGIGNGVGGTLYVEESLISENTAAVSGGGISNRGSATLVKTEVAWNETLQLGGAGLGNTGQMEVKYSHIHHNTANNSGAGILNTGTLEVIKSTIEANTATTGSGGGIYNCDPNLCAQSPGSAIAFITDSVIKSNSAEGGGGITGWETVGSVETRITSSKIVDNTAPNNGGGILSNAFLSIETSTIGGNITQNPGGGVFNALSGVAEIVRSTIEGNESPYAAGMFNGGQATLTNVTISGNTANYGPGIVNCAGTCSTNNGVLNLINVTIADNINTGGSGGALANDSGSTTAVNTLVADTQGGPNCSGLITSLGFNLSTDNTCAASFNQAGDQNNADANIGPLANNGGSTQTHALLAGSDALDEGTNTGCPGTDQRGISRPQASVPKQFAICDIGAYEFETPSRDFSGSRNPRRGGGRR